MFKEIYLRRGTYTGTFFLFYYSVFMGVFFSRRILLIHTSIYWPNFSDQIKLDT